MSRWKLLRWRLSGLFEQRRHPIDVAALMRDLEAAYEMPVEQPKRRRGQARPGCPTPGKVAYASLASARGGRARAANKGTRMRPYLCECGAYHLASNRRKAA